MAKQGPMDSLERALDAESLDWMMREHPEIISAIQEALDNGSTPEDIRWRVQHHSGRYELAKRCELCARALAAGE